LTIDRAPYFKIKQMNHQLHINSVLGDLELRNTSVKTSDILLVVYQIFEKDKTTPGLILLNEGQFHGLLSRARFFEVMSRQFMYDIYSKRRIDYFFEEDKSKYLILNSSTTIIDATNEALKRPESDIFEPIIVTCGNNEFRLLDFYQLLVAQNQIQLLMNELLKQANEFKKEVLAITAHDLRNPIGAVLGLSNLMAQGDDMAECKEFALLINKTASQMQDLVNSFLVSAINGSIEFELEFSGFDIAELIRSVVKSFEEMAKQKKQNIFFESQDCSVHITSDRVKIKEVVENLLSNAMKYSEEGKEIKIALQENGHSVQIMVKDQGPGFLPSDLVKIFGKFQRLSARPTGNESSTGLGLFITKKIIDKLNGSIDLESEPGNGATFTVRIPGNGSSV
jgi:signal transduction histidine kinase